MTNRALLLGKHSVLSRKHSFLFCVCLGVAALGDPAFALAQAPEVPAAEAAPSPSLPLEPPPVVNGAPDVAPVLLTPVTGHRVQLPSHLSIGNQQFDASVAGFRAYLDTIKETNPGLHAQLAPDLERLESKTDGARMVFLGGWALASRRASTRWWAGRIARRRWSTIRGSRRRWRRGVRATRTISTQRRRSVSSAWARSRSAVLGAGHRAGA